MQDKVVVLYAARHGTTDLNAQDCFRGLKDVSLDKAGFRDANKLAELFEPIEISFIVYSDRKRTTQTAEIIAERKDMKDYTQATESLRAWNVGKFSGQPKNEENVAAVEWYVANPDEVIPQGESLNAFKHRVRPAIIDAVKASNHIGEPGLIVAHSSIIHEISSMFHGDHEMELVDPGGAVAIFFDPKEGLKSEAVFKPRPNPKSSADTVS